MPNENPWAYNEARNRIREKIERETVIKEQVIENFEKTKERVRSGKKLDVFELKRRIETGQSLSVLKGDIQSALENGQISIDTYTDVLKVIDEKTHEFPYANIDPEYTLPPWAFPLSDTQLAQYFDRQKLWVNPLIDIAGFAYGFAQGSVFLLFLAWRMILDFLLLPRDIIHSFTQEK